LIHQLEKVENVLELGLGGSVQSVLTEVKGAVLTEVKGALADLNESSSRWDATLTTVASENREQRNVLNQIQTQVETLVDMGLRHQQPPQPQQLQLLQQLILRQHLPQQQPAATAPATTGDVSSEAGDTPKSPTESLSPSAKVGRQRS